MCVVCDTNGCMVYSSIDIPFQRRRTLNVPAAYAKQAIATPTLYASAPGPPEGSDHEVEG